MAVRIPVKEVELGSSGTAHKFQRCSQAEVNRIMYEMIRSVTLLVESDNSRGLRLLTPPSLRRQPVNLRFDEFQWFCTFV